MSDRKKEEKERLWKEVMSKKRSTPEEDIELVLGTESETKESSSVLKSADAALSQLNAILLKQKKQLEKMNAEAKARNNIRTIDEDMEELESSLAKDYGVVKQEEPQPVDSKVVFQKTEETLQKNIFGQQEALQSLMTGFRRPYVIGYDENKARNVILIMGPEGSGRHAALSLLARSLYEQQVFVSDAVNTIDLSLYTSASQEQIFLQDLYRALKSNAGILCFENFENCFPSFLRMIASLAADGKTILNKRYVLSNGVLVENQTGLVKDSVDALSASGKYLVFITDGSIHDVQDAFGADFMFRILDIVRFAKLSEEAVSSIIDLRLEQLKKTCSEKFGFVLNTDETLKTWILAHYDKNAGADGIVELFQDFYVSLSEIKLNHDDTTSVTVQCTPDPVGIFTNGQISLQRDKNVQEEIEAVQKEINQIVGLTEVKSYISSLQAHMKVQQRRKEQGMKTSDISKHMIFTGNPGTGKTTIARLLSRYMKAIGALSKGQLVEVSRADLVAQYVGQTAPLTMSVIKSAIGGVLFIDEAYALYRGKEDSFGLEAIDTLVKAMEDNREDLIVILAGYKKEMAAFLDSNSGLKSRFPNIIEFPDYTGEEMTKIAVIQAESKGYHILEDAVPALTEYFTAAQKSGNSGNGRLARNVVEEAILSQSKRIANDETAAMDELQRSDFDLTI